jgi:predicted nucleic acid-binding protein
MISTFTAVFDSCVFFSNRLTSLLMWLAMSGLFRARWSDDIHQEWMRAVGKERGIPIEKLQARRQYMDQAVPDCCVSGYEDLIVALMLPDPDDRHVLAAAIRCHASVIVTFNLKDFPLEPLAKYGIHTRHPDDFILDVGGISQGTLIEAARYDFEHYRDPSLTVDEYIEGLRIAQVPKTAIICKNYAYS